MQLPVSKGAQVFMIWVTLICMAIWGLADWALLGMVPLPPATLTPDQVAAMYSENAFKMRLGAVITSYTGGFMIPFSTVVAIQLARLEKGVPIWSIMSLGGGWLMSVFFVLPPMFWGIGAFTPDRLPAVTAVLNEMGNLSQMTTDQWYIYQMGAIAYVILAQTPDPTSAFPRWLGWFTIWVALVLEAGAVAFMFKTGPFAWNGLFVFWFPFVFYGIWIVSMCVCMLKGIKRQVLPEVESTD